jgi:hypothetical protein
MTALRKRLIEDIQLRNFSPHTVEAYVRAVSQFSRHYGRSPDQLSGEQVRQYLLYLGEMKVTQTLTLRFASPSVLTVIRPRRTPEKTKRI